MKVLFKIDRWFLLAILILLAITGVRAQQGYTEMNKRPLPLTPNVAAMLKFDEIPINYFNGTTDISIPLFEVKNENATIPLVLSYHTGGIKVSEEASWVGLGWNLNIGGCIQEIIVGNPDIETHGFSMSDYNSAPKPVPPPGGWGSYQNSYNITEAGFCYVNSTGQVQSYDPMKLAGSNFEYDMFSFSFMGNSGKFLFLGDSSVCLDRKNIIFKKIISNSQTIIKATTPDGTVYVFDKVGITKTQKVCENTNSFAETRTWYLSLITYPDRRTVKFNYIKTTARTLPTADETWIYTEYEPTYQVYSGGARSVIQNYSTIDNYFISSVEFDSGRIDFETSARQDAENSLKLNNIRLYQNESSEPVKQVGLGYSYFTGTGSPQNDWTKSSLWGQSITCGGYQYYMPSDDFKSKRLKLDRIDLLHAAEDGISPASYLFEYNESLPYKTSFSVDLYGYYNGVNNTGSFLPDYNKLGYWDDRIPYAALSAVQRPTFADRSVNENSKAGTLKKITYPTGGYSTLSYECNKAYNANSSFKPSIVERLIAVSDTSRKGYQQVEFNIPSIGYQVYDSSIMSYRDGNPCRINLTLFCCPGTPSCNEDYLGACKPYQANSPNFGLYVVLQYFDTRTNSWLLDPDHIYDISKNIVRDNHGYFTIEEALRPGKYRIIANYPDDAVVQGGFLSREAAIRIWYKENQYNSNPVVYNVGGVRIKSVLDFDNTGNQLLQRNFTYSVGRLMIQPQFYRFYTPSNVTQSLSANCVGNHIYDNVLESNKACNTCGTLGIIPATTLNYKQYTISSNPLFNYSYSAQGGLVGYDTVTVIHDNAGDIGKVERVFNCYKDDYNEYGGLVMTGVPTSPNFLSGSLSKETVFKKSNAGYSKLKTTSYTYNIFNYDQRWCFKSEYKPLKQYGCNGATSCGLMESSIFSYSQFLLHFYPIKFGKLNRISIIDSVYENEKLIVKRSDLSYNIKGQLKDELSVESNGKTSMRKIFYPSDYVQATGFVREMQQRNMIDYPLEQHNNSNGLTSKASFREYNLHDDIISLSREYSSKNTNLVDIIPYAQSNVLDPKYTLDFEYEHNELGNLISVKPVGGRTVRYLWSNRSEGPTAEVLNCPANDFGASSFETTDKGNWSYDGNTVEHNLAPTGKRVYALTGGLTKQGLFDNKIYVLSYWSNLAANYQSSGTSLEVKNGPSVNGWTYHQHLITGTSSLSLSGNGLIDEVRIYPRESNMSTFTYSPLVGLTSRCDFSGRIEYYEYDRFRRLKYIKDGGRNIVKEYSYNYKK